jgi:hypothetical protein
MLRCELNVYTVLATFSVCAGLVVDCASACCSCKMPNPANYSCTCPARPNSIAACAGRLLGCMLQLHQHNTASPRICIICAAQTPTGTPAHLMMCAVLPAQHAVLLTWPCAPAIQPLPSVHLTPGCIVGCALTMPHTPHKLALISQLQGLPRPVTLQHSSTTTASIEHRRHARQQTVVAKTHIK